MPKHYAVGGNVKEHTAQFNNVKSVVIPFDEEWEKIPLVQLTMGDTGTVPASKSIVTKTSLTIRLQSTWSGSIDAIVMERS